jgi:hypothetical protein
VSVALGDAPARLSRLDPTAWRDAWSDERITLEQKRELADAAWTPVDLGTLAPGTFGGSSLWAGDLGVAGRTTGTQPVPQRIDGTEALKIGLAGVTADAVTLALADFEATVGGDDVHEAARVLFLDGDDAIVEEAFVHAGDGARFDFDGLDDVAGVVLQAGAADADGDFVPGATSDGSSETTSAYSLDRIEIEGQEMFIA